MPHHIAPHRRRLDKKKKKKSNTTTNFKMNPPCASKATSNALSSAGLAATTIEILAQRSTPRTPPYEKDGRVCRSSFGIVGLETELGLFSQKSSSRRPSSTGPKCSPSSTVNSRPNSLALTAAPFAPGAVATSPPSTRNSLEGRRRPFYS